MRLVIGLLSIIILNGSCQNDTAPLSQSKMAAVLTDLHLAEALGQLSPIDSGGYMVKNRDSIFAHYQYIFNHHQLSSQQFNTALDWYSTQPQLFDEIYEIVLAELSTIKDKNTIEMPTEKKPNKAANKLRKAVYDKK